MQNIKEIVIIISPSIICAIIILATKMGLDYYPLSFGLVIGLINRNVHKNNFYLGILLSLIISYASFIISYASTGIFSEILKPLLGEDKAGLIALMVFPFILAPLLVFFSYRLIFNYKIKTKFSKTIIISSIILLVIIFYVNYQYVEYGQKQQQFSEILNPYTLWQVVVALALQLIINQSSFNIKKSLVSDKYF